MIRFIKKRDSRVVPFDIAKIDEAIFRAAKAQGGTDRAMSRNLADQVLDMLETEGNDTPDVEHVQDLVEKVLIEAGHARTAKAYILYRAERTRVREMKTRLMNTLQGSVLQADAKELDLKRENANIDGDTAMGTMLRYGSRRPPRQFYENYLLSTRIACQRPRGTATSTSTTWTFCTLTTTCCQIDIEKLFRRRLLHRPRLSARTATTFAATRAPLPALPSSPTRTTSTAARAFRTSTTVMAPGVARKTSPRMSISPSTWRDALGRSSAQGMERSRAAQIRLPDRRSKRRSSRSIAQ